uniref:Uncharacterized protein n=1 Tax=Entomoneis paludosa TaxID=265537 RepID=A0A7S2YBJ1_9STRA
MSQKIQELNLTSQYDRFIVTRSDHYYLCEHNVSGLNKSNIWLPEGEHYDGYTDRHWVLSKHVVLQALDIYPHFLQKRKDFFTMLNPEGLVKQIWDKRGLPVKIFPRVMFTCAVPGDDKSSLGAKMRGRPERQGVHLKYFPEYKLSHRGCGLPFKPIKKRPRSYRSRWHAFWRHAKNTLLGRTKNATKALAMRRTLL